jgi:hypothetical protein
MRAPTTDLLMNADDPADVTDGPTTTQPVDGGPERPGWLRHCPTRHHPPQQHCAYEPSVGTTNASRVDVAPVRVMAPIGAATLAGVI